jgi:hypothetical protein
MRPVHSDGFTSTVGRVLVTNEYAEEPSGSHRDRRRGQVEFASVGNLPQGHQHEENCEEGSHTISLALKVPCCPTTPPRELRRFGVVSLEAKGKPCMIVADKMAWVKLIIWIFNCGRA